MVVIQKWRSNVALIHRGLPHWAKQCGNLPSNMWAERHFHHIVRSHDCASITMSAWSLTPSWSVYLQTTQCHQSLCPRDTTSTCSKLRSLLCKLRCWLHELKEVYGWADVCIYFKDDSKRAASSLSELSCCVFSFLDNDWLKDMALTWLLVCDLYLFNQFSFTFCCRIPLTWIPVWLGYDCFHSSPCQPMPMNVHKPRGQLCKLLACLFQLLS